MRDVMRQQEMSVINLFLEVAVVGGLAFAAAAVIPPFNAGLLLFVLIFAVHRFRIRLRNSPRNAIIAFAGSFIVGTTILAAAAIHKPSKTTERVLSQRMTLQSKQMSLAELDFHCTFNREQFPIRISLSFADKKKNTMVRWDDRELTLRDFLGTLQAQTGLTHEFGHCGNGWTLLNGGDCSFGLMVFDPDVAGPSREPVFETGSYIPDEYKQPHNKRVKRRGESGGL